MGDKTYQGSCLCGEVHFEVTGPFTTFQYCHCSRCQKVSGSAHAANLFVKGPQFRWTRGEDMVERFQSPEAKYFATSFCRTCGAKLPWQPTGVTTMVIPAGAMDSDPEVRPERNIFRDSGPCWYREPADLQSFATLPGR